MRHRFHERIVGRTTGRHLLAEAERHQQRVVDRDAEPDERDQELNDDRHVRDVGQREHAREGRQDRGRRHRKRHRHGRERAEDEEEDDQRAGAAEERLGEDARSRRFALRLKDRVAPGQMARHAGRSSGFERGPRLRDRRERRERRVPARVDCRHHRVVVGREVHITVCLEPRAHAGPLDDPCRRRDRPVRAGHLRDVPPGRREHDDERRLLSRAECLQHALVRLVGGVAGDRKRLEPAARELRGGEPADDRERDPGPDHEQAVADDEPGDASHHTRGYRFRRSCPS